MAIQLPKQEREKKKRNCKVAKIGERKLVLWALSCRNRREKKYYYEKLLCTPGVP